MEIRHLIWDARNVEHIARHKVEPYEVEEACEGRYLIIRVRGGRYALLGQTSSGRYLFVVLDAKGAGVFRVVTARDMTPAERRRYRKGK